MEDRVIFRAGKAANLLGLAAIRFNFRGVGNSSGSFGFGEGEMEDVEAVIDWLVHRYAGLPLGVIGFSFGAWVGLRVGCRDSRIGVLIGLSLPLNGYDFDFLVGNPKPTLCIVGRNDQFCPQEKLDFLERHLPHCSAVLRIEGADHFFSWQLDQVQQHITQFLRQWLSQSA